MRPIRLDECTLPQRRLILALRAAAEAALIDLERTPVDGEGSGAESVASPGNPATEFGGASTNQPPFAAKHAALRRLVETAPADCSAGTVMEVADESGEPQPA
jgi:hypothetical protein